jgi:dolichol kinase
MGSQSVDLLIEIRRKAIHLPALIIPFGLYFFPAWFSIPTLYIVTFLAVTVELLRFQFENVQKIFYKYFGYLLREHERRRITGSTALLLSSALCTLFFATYKPEFSISDGGRISMFYAFTFLILGDAIAAIAGKKIGGPTIPGGKTVAGSLGCLLTCFTIYFICNGTVVKEIPFTTAIAGMILTTVLEALPIPLDDNLRVAPAVCAVLRVLI